MSTIEPGWRPDAEPIDVTTERFYTIGIPLAVSVDDDGHIVFDFDLSEVASKHLEPVDDDLPEDVRLADLTVVEAACKARGNSHTFVARVVTINNQEDA
jgi:hypothetical protein